MQLPVDDQCCSPCHAVRISHWYTVTRHWAEGAFCIVYGWRFGLHECDVYGWGSGAVL